MLKRFSDACERIDVYRGQAGDAGTRLLYCVSRTSELGGADRFAFSATPLRYPMSEPDRTGDSRWHTPLINVAGTVFIGAIAADAQSNAGADLPSLSAFDHGRR